MYINRTAKTIVFLSTLSLRRATIGPLIFSVQPRNFYPRSPCGERQTRRNWRKLHELFLSTLSLRRATKPKNLKSRLCVISIHALLAESDRFGAVNNTKIHISIHALLAESDLRVTSSTRSQPSISIHALLAESDSVPFRPASHRSKFLSTLSLRRATPRGDSCYLDNIDFYPRSPCGERPRQLCPGCRCCHISIHALLAESDNATEYVVRSSAISIHALLAESDVSPDTSSTQCRLFLSTLSLRRATNKPTRQA